jgi:predicted ATPase
MLRILHIENLNGKLTKTIRFNEDLNVITGKNGSGKTTLLKLIWYLLSGNIERIPREMTFDYVYLASDKAQIRIKKTNRKTKTGDPLYAFNYRADGERFRSSQTFATIAEERPFIREANMRIAASAPSIFFSTFRRLEGGFGMDNPKSRRDLGRRYSPAHSLNEQIRELSDLLSVMDHKFIASISTDDIVRLLTERYAEISEQTNHLHLQLSEYIQHHIQEYSVHKKYPENEKLNQATQILDEIQKEVTRINHLRDQYLTPFNVLEELVPKIFNHEGIRITPQIVIGREDDPVDSSKLSSGEKQMLSFLCYNAFYNNIPIFIDEPEISLHVDWQRVLLPTLLAQKTGNQFIAATHSPFIYSQYPDKEISLDEDRGHTNQRF